MSFSVVDGTGGTVSNNSNIGVVLHSSMFLPDPVEYFRALEQKLNNIESAKIVTIAIVKRQTLLPFAWGYFSGRLLRYLVPLGLKQEELVIPPGESHVAVIHQVGQMWLNNLNLNKVLVICHPADEDGLLSEKNRQGEVCDIVCIDAPFVWSELRFRGMSPPQ